MAPHHPPTPSLGLFMGGGEGAGGGDTDLPPPPMSPWRRGDLEQQLRTVIDELGKASAKVGGGNWGHWRG